MTGPVRQVETVPTDAEIREPMPHAAVIMLTGGVCPAASSTAKPCAFCAASTVMASGSTSSTMAAPENSGA